MINFTYYTPTRIVFGKGAENNVGALIKEQGCKKVLVHYGSESAKRSGLLDRVFASLDDAGIDYVSLGGVVPNPRLSKAREGIELGRAEGVDFILAVGGGSVIDSSKCIGYGLANPDVDVWEFYKKTATPTACLPVGVILTIAAAGSETSNSSVITNEDGWLKRGCNTDFSRPRFAIMDPELTYTLPAYQKASGSTDILMHTLERYFQQEDMLAISKGMSVALLKDVMKNAPIAIAEPENYEAHAEIMWCGSLSHINLMELGGTHGDWSCHQLEHELSGMFDVAHGAGLAAVWGSWARYVMESAPKRFADFAVDVMGVEPEEDELATGLKGIEAFEDYLRSVNMPTSIRELGIEPTDEQIHELAVKCSFFGSRKIGVNGIR
ncbi:MAG: iron-containing alcohol dehydrogenase, partial [Atopobiaceae bacterium]|nr:iron-containing alcohol dehydrogenase [Atopobiaceae bacterium]